MAARGSWILVELQAEQVQSLWSLNLAHWEKTLKHKIFSVCSMPDR